MADSSDLYRGLFRYIMHDILGTKHRQPPTNQPENVTGGGATIHWYQTPETLVCRSWSTGGAFGCIIGGTEFG